MYKHLWTNSPKEASLEFPDYTFAEHFKGKPVPSFLPWRPVREYLETRVDKMDVQRFIRFFSVVKSVKEEIMLSKRIGRNSSW